MTKGPRLARAGLCSSARSGFGNLARVRLHQPRAQSQNLDAAGLERRAVVSAAAFERDICASAKRYQPVIEIASGIEPVQLRRRDDRQGAAFVETVGRQVDVDGPQVILGLGHEDQAVLFKGDKRFLLGPRDLVIHADLERWEPLRTQSVSGSTPARLPRGRTLRRRRQAARKSARAAHIPEPAGESTLE